MKKTLLFLFLTVFGLSFSACSSDDDDNGDGGSTTKKVTISIYYKMQNSEYDYPDSYSKVYVFRNTGFKSDKYRFESGKLYNKETGNWTDPAQSLSNDNNVLVEVNVNYDCTVVVESKHYEGSYEIQEKSLKDNDRTMKIVFSAQ